MIIIVNRYENLEIMLQAAQYPTVGWLAARWFPARHQGVMLGIVFLGEILPTYLPSSSEVVCTLCECR